MSIDVEKIRSQPIKNEPVEKSKEKSKTKPQQFNG